ncbi:MAG: hypothetical protein KGZ63_05530 [Clostridiales bacterium]|nr:hypothetical protein [Clostridiales bacterium]
MMRIAYSEIFMFISLLIYYIAIPISLFFIIKYFIRYNVQQNGKKTKQQEELDKMSIEDL